MKLTVLGSGSSGNGYVLQNDKEALIIECGMPFTMCEEALGFNVSKIAGCLVSHVHGDHIGYINQYMPFMNVYMSAGTIEAARLSGKSNVIPLQAKRQYRIGDFTVMPFFVEHDAPQPFGYLIKHPDFGLLMFATDTYYLRYTFKGLNYIMLECNYEKKRLDENVKDGIISQKVRERVVRSHLSCIGCIKTLLANNLSTVRMIMLLHLSRNNGNKAKFLQMVKNATGKQTMFAEKGLQIELF